MEKNAKQLLYYHKYKKQLKYYYNNREKRLLYMREYRKKHNEKTDEQEIVFKIVYGEFIINFD
jgi:hypothetical protein